MIPILKRFLSNSSLALTVAGTLVAGILLSSCTQVKVANPKTDLEIAPAPYYDAKTGIYFPGALGPLFRRPVVELEERYPGLGFAISYRSKDSRIDVFVFDLQASIIPEGIDSEVIEISHRDAIADLKLAAKKRIYTNLRISPESERAIARTTFRQSSFTYTESLTPKSGLLLLAGINSQIIKIRTSQRVGSGSDLDRLISYLGQSIEQSKRNGYGGISNAEYKKIAATLPLINLRDGLSEQEAISIAQIHLVEQGRHNRYDATTAELSQSQLPESATVRFRQYPMSPARLSPTPLDIIVDDKGNARITR